MGAATFTPATGATSGATTNGQSPYGVTHDGYRYVQGTITMSTSYATGGDTLAWASIPGGVKRVVRLEYVSTWGNIFGGIAGYTLVLNGPATNPTLKAMAGTGASAAVEVANGTNLSARVLGGVRIVYAGA